MESLKMPALGEDIQLGMLYNYKTGTFYSGVSPWSSSVANPRVDMAPEFVQNAEYKLFTSLDDARKYADLSVEGSLSLDLGVCQATGSAAYLSKKKSTAYEARVDVSCTIVRRTRRIPQQMLVNMEYPELLNNNDFTHFVAEVVEGGTATLTFVQSCDTLEEMKKVQGNLEATLKSVNLISGGVEMQLENTDAIKKERLSISYSGALAVQVATLEDALRVAKEMPGMLKTQMNTLSYKLLPVYLLGNAYTRQINYLDSELLKQASDALRFGESTLLELGHIDVTLKNFTMIAPQVRNMINAVDAATRQFTSRLRKLLPELRDALADTAAKMDELQSAVKLYQFQMQAASNYLFEKQGEALYLKKSVEELCEHGFVNELNGTTTYSHPLGGPPTLLLSLSGEKVINSLHPLQQHVQLQQLDEDGTKVPPDENETKVLLDEDDRVRVNDSYEKLKSLKDRLRELGAEAPAVTFAVANISKVQRGGSESVSKYASTAPGDVVLGHKGRLVVVTGKLPGYAAQSPPTLSTVSHDHVVVDVPINHRGGSEPEPIDALTPTKIHVRWRHRGDSFWTGTATLDWSRDARQLVVSPLLPEIEYEVQMCIHTKLGPTCWSSSTAVKTTKAPPSLLSKRWVSPMINDMELFRTLEGHSDWVTSVAFNGDGRTLASGSSDNTIKLWDVATGLLLQTLKGHSKTVSSVAFSSGGTLASGSLDKTIKLWEVATGQLLRTLEGHSLWVKSVTFSSDGCTLASGSLDKTIRLWDVATGELRRILKGHTGEVYSVAFSRDSHTLVSVSDDKTIRLWEVATEQQLHSLMGHSDCVLSVAISNNGRTLASGSLDKTIKLWETATGQLVRTLKGHSERVRSVAFSSDDSTLASGSWDTTIKLWDVATGALLQTLEGHSGSVSSVAFSTNESDGNILVSGSGDRTIKLWRMTS